VSASGWTSGTCGSELTRAIERARLLLAERHEPLVMTPGDVRKLLARTQRCLAELADACEHVTAVSGQDDAS
jgi:hypothetical protein